MKSPDSTNPHHTFDDESADTILCSQDGVNFPVHSLTLKLASQWFRALFTLPQGHTPAATVKAEPIRVSESSAVLADILGMISGQEVPQLHDIVHVASLLQAAEKYEMHGVMSVLRLALVSPPLLEKYPVRVYGLACHYGWMEEAKMALSKTIGLDLLSENVRPELHALDPAFLTKLMLLHRRRRDALRKQLDSSVFYANNIPGRCTGCQTLVAHESWLRLKAAWMAAADHAPQDLVSREILQSEELFALLNTTCPSCHTPLYHGQSTMMNLRNILKELPTTVEVSRLWGWYVVYALTLSSSITV